MPPPSPPKPSPPKPSPPEPGPFRIWGRGYGGSLGDGRAISSERPVVVEGVAGAVDLALDGGLGCALTAGGELWCWGHGALLDGADYLPRPARVDADVQALGRGRLCIQRRGEATWRCR